MTRPAALVLMGESERIIGGLTLTERAALLAYRAGFRPVHIAGKRALEPESHARLRSRHTPVIPHLSTSHLEGIGDEDGLLVVGPDVLFEPRVLGDLVDGAGPNNPGATTASAAGVPTLLYVPPGSVAAVRGCGSLDAMIAHLTARGTVRDVLRPGRFCRHIAAAERARAVERDYVRHLNGGNSESYFTKKIRRFSVPLTTVLVRLGARPAQVTAGGLVLALISAWLLARGNYFSGLVGAVLYYASMVFDCSDGEVARLTVRDSRFGAWLETMVDYLTYFLLLGALTIASQNLPDAGPHQAAALVALAGTVLVSTVATYLRHRVAAADPGQFDDASATVMASASPLHRFASWARQWIKRSSVAHLVVILALVNQLPALLYLWAFGAVAASVVILAVEPFVARRVAVAPARIPDVDAR